MRIAIAADHAGMDLRDQLAHHLRLKGHQVDDLSPENDPEDDYPLIVEPIARAIVGGRYERGIFCCGSGIGPAVAANKIPGIRAAVVEHEWSARDAVEHVNVNLITLGERVIGIEIAKAIVDAYLGAQVQGGRHERRRKQIEDLEKVKAKT
ncbi:MAG TPA: ribose-5-phosphate isomerase [Chloroflexi bacterium]|nr:ribose-5-phosphate isomerase [Chloroflexota bacterium]HAL27247.1 ribose-5-phosphate isomerase [Chloroflexota bacterium]